MLKIIKVEVANFCSMMCFMYCSWPVRHEIYCKICSNMIPIFLSLESFYLGIWSLTPAPRSNWDLWQSQHLKESSGLRCSRVEIKLMMHTRTDTMSAAHFWIHYVAMMLQRSNQLRSTSSIPHRTAFCFDSPGDAWGGFARNCWHRGKANGCAIPLRLDIPLRCLCGSVHVWPQVGICAIYTSIHQCIYPIHWPNMRPVDKATQAGGRTSVSCDPK